MAFNGSGVYSPPGTDFPAVTQTVISSTKYNNVINDIATALSLCLTKDGQQTATANIPFGGFRATNVGITAVAGSVGTPAINVSDATTGLYRSAVSELAVSIAGTQRARFDSTGLIVTGTVTATTSVVTPLVDAGTAGTTLTVNSGPSNNILLRTRDADTTPRTQVVVAHTAGADQFVTLRGGNGAAPQIVGSTNGLIIDSGTAGSLALKTNNGTTGLTVRNAASGINFLSAQAGAAGNPPIVSAIDSSETNVGVQLYTKGTGTFSIGSDVSGVAPIQFQVLHTASASRNITVTGSNGGNPTIGVTAGSLAITPAVVIAGATVSVGTNSATGTLGYNMPYNNFLYSRNAANNGDLTLLTAATLNAVTDITFLGTSAGVVGVARSKAGAPTTSDLPPGSWMIWRDSSGATTKLYYNNAGALQSVALA